MSFEIKNNIIIWKDNDNKVFNRNKLCNMYLTGKCCLTGNKIEPIVLKKIIELLSIIGGKEWAAKIVEYKKYKNIPPNVFLNINKIGKKLGDGKYGSVWDYNGYAIKKIKKADGLVEKKSLELLNNNISRQLISPCIIDFYQYSRQDGIDYLVFEKVPGTLWSFLQSNPSTKNIKGIIIQVIFTLLVCSHLFPGFRHNDLKTDNILLDKTIRKKPIILKYGKYRWKISEDIPLVKIADFDYCNIPKYVKNNKVGTEYSSTFGCTKINNKIYDVHLFLNSVYSQAVHFQPNVKKWLEKQLPKNTRGTDSKSVKYGRLRNPGKWNKHIASPLNLLNDPFFKSFKITSPKTNDSNVWGL